MKHKFFLLICITVCSSSVLWSQTAPRKFDEFEVNDRPLYYSQDRVSIPQRIERLTKYLRLKPKATVFIIAYKGRRSTYESRRLLDNWSSDARSTVAYQTKVGDKRAFLLDGGYRDSEMIEFWIGDEKSKQPMPTPKYTDEYKFECVDIYVGEKGMNFDPNHPATFSAWTYPERDLTFIWTPSVGEVAEGQGTKSVAVNTKGNTKVTLFVEVKGLPEVCERVVFKTFEIGRRPYLADEVIRYMYSDLAARVDGFMVMVNANPQLTGYIIAYAGRSKNDRVERDRALASVRRIFAFRRYDNVRVKLIDGGVREYNSAEMWLVPPGVEPPKPTPSVDPSFIKKTRQRVRFGDS